MAAGNKDDKKAKFELISIEVLESEFNSFAAKLKNELQKAHTRVNSLEKELSVKEDEFSSTLKQEEDRYSSLSLEMMKQREECTELKNKIKLSEKSHSRERCYLMNMNEENKKLIETLNGRIKSMNTEIKQLNCEHSKETEQLKFDLNETKHSLTCKLNEDKIRETETGYKMHQMEEENLKLCEIVKNLNAEIKTLTSEKQLQSREKKELDKQHANHEKYIQKLHEHIEETEEQKMKIKDLSLVIKEERDNFNDLSYQYNVLVKQIQSLKEENQCLTREKHELLLRLSKVAGADLSYRTADLSDEKRPTKLAEEFSELFDNEWTDAFFEDLQIKNEEERVTFMLKLLMRANRLCNELCTDHMRKIQQSFCTLTFCKTTPVVEVDKENTEICIKRATATISGRKTLVSAELNDVGETEEVCDEVPGRLAPVVCEELNDVEKTAEVCDEVPGRIAQDNTSDETKPVPKIKKRKVGIEFEQALNKDRKNVIMELGRFFKIQLACEVEKVGTEIILEEYNIDTGNETVIEYIRKCMNICWSLCRHVPPVHVDFPDVTENILFDTNKYKPYTKSGKYVQYIVWPAVYLHEGGPLLNKGVAQGRK